MRIVSSDYARIFEVGTFEIWSALSATIEVLISRKRKDITLALNFLSNGVCESKDCIECAKEFNLIRDCLSQFPPDNVVYDASNRSYVPDWAKNISPVITSCANFFTTSDGQDLLFEIVSILCYGGITGHRITIEN